MKKCIIGKNSKIIKGIKSELRDFDFLSHTNCFDFDFSKYSHIYLFSWSHSSQDENMKILKALPIEKVIFVSTVAVYANAIKLQWNKYPLMKLQVENIILRAGGKVLRLGICDQQLLKKHKGLIPFTTSTDIINFLNLEAPSQVTNLFYLAKGGINPKSLMARFNSCVNRVCDILPSHFIYQAPLELFLKMLGSSDYGYTNNALRFFGDSTQIGYGAIGSHYWNAKLSSNNDILLVSPKNDILLDSNGFRGLRIGKNRTGLSKFWHGVSIVRGQKGFSKNVPMLVHRPSLPNYAVKVEAKNFDYNDGAFKVLIDSPIEKLEILSNKLILAAGAIENCKIINRTVQKDVTLSDHEIGFIGTINCDEIIKKGYLKKIGPFLIGRGVFCHSISPAFILDFRPFSKAIINSKYNLYNDSASGILVKLLKRFTFGQLNEAFFNKFGVGVSSNKLGVFIQLEVKNCISLSSNQTLKRKRTEKEKIKIILEMVKNKFPSFNPSCEPYLFDGIHVTGGEELLNDSLIKSLLKSGKLIIVGSPTRGSLGPFHNTKRQIDEFLKN